MKKVLVTGGTGHLGSWLVKALSAEGNEVVAIARKPEEAQFLNFPGVNLVKADIQDPVSLLNAMRDVEEVYHLAAFAGVWAKDRGVFHRMNVLGTENVLKSALESGVKKVVVTSSAGNFGPSTRGVITEETRREIPFFNEYERTKHAADEVALEFAGKMDIVLVYPTRVYGPVFHGPANSVSLVMEKMVRGNFRLLPSDGSRIGNYVFVDDVVKGFQLAMQKGRSGEKYILGGKNHSLLEVYIETWKAAGKSVKPIQMPLGLIKVFAASQQLLPLIGKAPKITSDWLAKLELDWIVSSEKAIRELGYSHTDLQEGVEKTVRSFLQSGNQSDKS